MQTTRSAKIRVLSGTLAAIVTVATLGVFYCDSGLRNFET